MKKGLLMVLWQLAKIALSMSIAISFMRAGVRFGVTPLEAGFAVVGAAVMMGAFLICAVIGAAVDSLHPKVDLLVSDVRDNCRRGE